MSLFPRKRITPAVKGQLKRLGRACVRRWYSFSRDDLLSLLRRLGVKPGDVLMAHSSFDRFVGFTGTPRDVIAALKEAVGAGGTILMPTIPFTGTAVDYVCEGHVFEVRRTPSRMGLLTELFRRSPGVLRSVHPTHPVAAWGAKAEEMVAGHHLARTPCGTGTPFARLLDYGGKILLLGTGIRAMSFFHSVEEILEPEMPFTPFTKETFSLQSIDKDGTVLFTTTYLFDPECARRRRPEKLIPALKERGAWLEGRVGRLDGILLDARDVLETCRALAKNGVYCYDP